MSGPSVIALAAVVAAIGALLVVRCRRAEVVPGFDLGARSVYAAAAAIAYDVSTVLVGTRTVVA